jgi:hypothetical protein
MTFAYPSHFQFLNPDAPFKIDFGQKYQFELAQNFIDALEIVLIHNFANKTNLWSNYHYHYLLYRNIFLLIVCTCVQLFFLFTYQLV